MNNSRKWTAILLTAAFMTAGTSGIIADAAPLMGDVNSDGNVNIMDVIRLNKAILGTADLASEEEIAADINYNGMADAGDALELLKMVLESEETGNNSAVRVNDSFAASAGAGNDTAKEVLPGFQVNGDQIQTLTDGTEPKTFDILYMPAYLPDAADYVIDSESTQNTPRKVRSYRWRNLNAQDPAAGGCYISFAQFTKDQFWDDFDNTTTPITVGGKPGYLQHFISHGKTSDDNADNYTLTWDNGDYILSVNMDFRHCAVTEEELFRIAESVTIIDRG